MKKRNPQDITLRNARAVQTKIAKAIKPILRRLDRLEKKLK